MKKEYYFSCHCSSASSIQESAEQLRHIFQSCLQDRGLGQNDLVFVRFFCSDVYTHTPLLEKLWTNALPCQRVYIGQTPLDSTFVSLQAYVIKGAQKTFEVDGALLVRHGAYQSLWTLDYPPRANNSRIQSDDVIVSFQSKLRRYGMNLEQHALRTWYYVRDVDNNYAGMVKSRVEHYEACGLTPKTHFITSTGIEACAPRPDVLVWMQGHAQLGLHDEQITYLKALDYLSPTHVYEVNFERGIRIDYGDRAHCHISGTASIDHVGNVLHVGDVIRQYERAVENVEALLREGNMCLQDIQAATVYLRDLHDYARIAPLVRKFLPQECAVNITHGLVCRPDWLVEIEVEAVAPHHSLFPAFV